MSDNNLMSSYDLYNHILAVEYLAEDVNKRIEKCLNNCTVCLSTDTVEHHEQDANCVEIGLHTLLDIPLEHMDISELDLDASLEELALNFKSCVISFHDEMGFSFASRVRKSLYAFYLFSLLKHLYAEDDSKARSLLRLIEITDSDEYISMKYKVLIRIGSRVCSLIQRYHVQGLSLLKIIDCDFIYSAKRPTYIKVTEILNHFPDIVRRYPVHATYTDFINHILQ